MAPRLLFLLLLYGLPAAAQPHPDAPGPWWKVPGLPSPLVTAVAQDTEGFIWAGTHLGLVRTDGHHVEAFRPSSVDPRSLPSAVINVGALLVDPEGTLWVGTKGGLCRRRPRTRGFDCTGRGAAGDALGGRDVVSLAVAPDGTVWAGTKTGLFRVHPGSLTSTPVSEEHGLPHTYVTSLGVASDGTLWVGTSRGLAVRPPGVPSFRRPEGFTDDVFISDILPTAGGAVWVATRGQGVVRLVPEAPPQVIRLVEEARALSETARVVVTLTQRSDGTILAGTWGGGLLRIDPRSLLAAPSPLGASGRPSHTERVVDVTTDREGNLWAATWEGLFVRSPRQAYDRLVYDPTDPGSLSHPRVTSLLVTQGPTLWVGTFGGGLNRCDPRTLRCQSYRADPDDTTSLCHNVVLGLAAGPDGTVWAATSGGGVCALNPEAGTFQRVGPTALRDAHVYDVAPLSTSEAWLATAQQGLILARRDENTRQWTEVARALPDVSVYAVRPTPGGAVWAGTLGRGTCRGGPRTAFTCGPTEGDPWTTVLTATADGVWAGGPGGLDWVPTQGSRRNVLSDETVDDPRVACVLDATSGLWVSTASGILRIDRRSLDVSLSASASGVPIPDSYYPACAEVTDDLLAFGTEGGVILFRPSHVSRPGSAPIRITALALGGVPADAPLPAHRVSPIVVRPHQGGPTFRFATLSYASPDSRQYVYRLEGYDDHWHGPTDDPTAAYPKLPPGSYTFLARPAFHPSASAASVPLRVLAPLWQRPWFLALASAALLAILAAAHRARTRHLLHVETTRRQIADDLHDDVGSRLSGLALALDVAARTLPDEPGAVVQRRADEARALLGDLRDTVWVVDGRRDSLADLVDRVRQTAEALLPGVEVAVETSGDLNLPLDMQTRRHLLFFCKEALHNAARHGDPSAVNIIVVARPDRPISVRIADDGCGFDGALDREALNGGHGLGSLHRRGEALGGAVTLDTRPGHGTAVTLTLPPGGKIARSRDASEPAGR